jgi:COP9 signalosome complex subunit 4
LRQSLVAVTEASRPVMAEELSRIAIQTRDQTARVREYHGFLEQAVCTGNASNLSAFVDHIVGDQVHQTLAVRLVADLVTFLQRLRPEVHRDIALYALSALSDRAHSFEQEITVLRLNLSQIYADEQAWSDAARTLSEIPFDGASRTVSEAFRAECYVKIARYFVEADNPTDAERFANRAGLLMRFCTDEGIRLMYRVCIARILDAKRRFEDASMKYYQLSQLAPGLYGDSVIGDVHATEALNYSITCAILAPAGPRRSRVLAILYSDERTRSLPVFPMLENIHMGRLLKTSQVDLFRPTLREHQMAVDGDGVSVLERAVMEHNLLAASRLYANIRVEELAIVLNVSCEKAESTAAKMIYEGRMSAIIDQLEGFVEFQTPGTRGELQRWDTQIENICGAVDECCDSILATFPMFAR